MTKLYQKDPLFFALACICVYVCTFSASESVSARLGAPYLFTVPAGVVLCLVLGGWIRRQGLAKFLGLCRFRGTAGQYLCFLPLMVPAGCNLWHGVQWLSGGGALPGAAVYRPAPAGAEASSADLLSDLRTGAHRQSAERRGASAHPAPAVLCLRHRAAVHRALPEEREPSARHTDSQPAQCFECLFHGRRGHFPNHFRRSSHADGVALHPVAGQKSIKKSCPRQLFFILLPPVPAQHLFYCPPDWPAGWRRTSARSRPSPAEKASAPAAPSRTAC